MNRRIVVVVMLGFALLASVVNMALIPSWAWDFMDDWERVNIYVSVVSLTAALLVASYVYRDNEVFDTEQRKLLKRIEKLEGVVDENSGLIDKRLRLLEMGKGKAERKPKQKQATPQ